MLEYKELWFRANEEREPVLNLWGDMGWRLHTLLPVNYESYTGGFTAILEREKAEN